ncbi:hypothetical protein BTN50_1620 (plasmid) [Candidatus Enterovibrio altilux]|uniref:Uncharacterized protein n=1 Tax=Candidatus Enterovibrio altilux TaxID=1927128 RepID=A0A291BAP9_9GAMM|nr:hypothetical protein BTN50_1620 [Candidatus Enterovibrio luxaltus]
MLTTPDNFMKLFVLNEQFYPFHQEKKQLVGNEIIHVI